MNKLRMVGLDEPLTTEQGQLIRSRAVFAARRQFVGRKLLPIAGPLGRGVTTFGYDVMTEVSDAPIDVGWPGRESQDTISLLRTPKAIPMVHKEFEINALDLAASQMSGTPLNLSVVESASYKVALMEDALIIYGWSRDGTNYDINGLYKSAVNSDTSDLPWATEANIATSIQNGVSALLVDNIAPPYNLVVNPIEYTYMLDVIANTGITYLDFVKSIIQGDVYVTAAMAAGDAMLLKADLTGMAEYVLAEDLTVQTEMLEKSGNLFGKVYVRGLPVVYDTNAICSLTAIESP